MSGSLDHISDAEILAVVGSGKVQAGRFANISYDLGIGCGEGALRWRLTKLERAGKITRCPRYTLANSIYWLVVG